MRSVTHKIGSTVAALALTLSTLAALAPSTGATVLEAANPTPIVIAADGSCCVAQPASPYPSSIIVTEASGFPAMAEVTLWGLKDTNAEGLQALLVGPNGNRIVLMASYDAGRHVTLNTDWSFATFGQPMECPEPEGRFRGSGATRPFDCGLFEPFPEPAPPGPYAERLEDLGSGGANGEWKLYVANEAGAGEGSIATGWSLKLELQPAGLPLPQNTVNQPSTSGGPEALEHAGLAAQEEYALFLAQQRQAAEQAQREREASERAQAARTTPPPCVVPALGGHSLAGAKRLLTSAHCRLGHVHVRRHGRKPLAVVHQSVPKGRHLADGSAIALVLGVRHARA